MGRDFAQDPVVARLWSKIQRSEGCWLWTACLSHGAPNFHDGRRRRVAARMVWELSNPPIPKGALLLRSCENPRCVRPEHHRLSCWEEVRSRGITPEYFWSKVNRGEGCWEWQGHRNRAGYGNHSLVSLGGERLAHRTAWVLAHGAIPDGMHVLHRCDNPPCCNPAHLFVGTHDDNMADMARKGRNPGGTVKGERHAEAKLTEAQVREMRETHALGGVSHRELARRYGISKAHAGDIVRRHSWGHLD